MWEVVDLITLSVDRGSVDVVTMLTALVPNEVDCVGTDAVELEVKRDSFMHVPNVQLIPATTTPKALPQRTFRFVALINGGGTPRCRA